MIKTEEVVKRSQWFSSEDFDRETAIDRVEAALRDRHDVHELEAVEVEKRMSGEWCVSVYGVTVDEEGDG